MAQFGGISGLGSPINYYGMIPDFRGEALQETQNQLGQQQVIGAKMQNQQMQRQLSEEEQLRQALPGAMNDPAKLQALAIKYPSQIKNIQAQLGFRDAQDVDATEKAVNALQQASSMGPEAVANALVRHAGVIQQKGTTPQQLMQMWAQSPEQFNNFLGTVKLGTLGAKDQFDVQDKAASREVTMRGQDLTAETARRGQDVSRANAQLAASTGMTGHNIAAARLQLDQNKFAFDIQQAQEKAELLKSGAPKITDATSRMIDASINDATASRNSADSMSALAQQFRQERPTTGLFGNASNMFAKVSGTDTALRDLRIRQNALVNNQVLRFLPPGPATDRDVEIVRMGAPTDMDNPEVVARWLDAMSNLERKSSQFNEFKAEWVSANGNPGQSRNSGNILGMDVQKGESLGQAAKRYMAQNPIEQQQAAAAQGRLSSYQNGGRSAQQPAAQPQPAQQQQASGAVNWSDLP
ncbi:phage DNA ejection protein [Pectobacterium parmentieri]|uniref:phage DNA ejection protein n=1 Tax=Pectobacterium parmentieri TaxID=1905730 RepID=UPI000D61B85E|nr:phage DNA ejection protein [Pectobacterium parmentieri]PWD58526.1 acyltransferase [Pectobacterium parmentieri]